MPIVDPSIGAFRITGSFSSFGNRRSRPETTAHFAVGMPKRSISRLLAILSIRSKLAALPEPTKRRLFSSKIF